MTKPNQAIVGRMPCGHVVAIDLDPSAKTRSRYARLGYDVITMSRDEALALFRVEAEAHWDQCKGQRKD